MTILWTGLRLLLTGIFILAGSSKFMGIESMVHTFDTLGFGQWFRYVTATIEVGGAVLLWVQRWRWLGAGLLLMTMIGAMLAHILILGPSMVPAAVLALAAGALFYASRREVDGAFGGSNG